MKAHTEQVATRTLQRMMRYQAGNPLDTNTLRAVTEVLFYYRSTKMNEPNTWCSGSGIRVDCHVIHIKTDDTNEQARGAVEDISLRPRSQLTGIPIEWNVESYLRTNGHPKMGGTAPPNEVKTKQRP